MVSAALPELGYVNLLLFLYLLSQLATLSEGN